MGRPRKPTTAEIVKKTVEELDKSSLATRGRVAQERMDALWYNEATGKGTDIDPMTSLTVLPAWVPLQWQSIDALMSTDGLAARICTAHPKAAMQNGFRCPADEALQKVAYESSQINFFQAGAFKTSVNTAMIELLTWARAFGGACLVKLVDDGLPLDVEEGKGALERVVVVHPPYVRLEYVYDQSSQHVMVSDSKGHWIRVHRSRCIIATGEPSSMISRMKLYGFGLSALQRPYDTLRRYYNVAGAADRLVNDASVGVFRMAGVMSAMAEGHGELVSARMASFNTMRSMYRTIVTDAEGNEDYTRTNASFAGLPEVVQSAKQELSAVCDGIPSTILWGDSPGGLGSNGDAEEQQWTRIISAYRDQQVIPIIIQLAAACGVELRDKDIEFDSIEEPTDAQKEAMDSSKATRAVALVGAGIASNDEGRAIVGLSTTGALDENAGKLVVTMPNLSAVLEEPVVKLEEPIVRLDAERTGYHAPLQSIVDEMAGDTSKMLAKLGEGADKGDVARILKAMVASAKALGFASAVKGLGK